MKIDYINSFVSIGIASLIAYGVYNISSKIIFPIGGFFFFAITLTSMMGMKFENLRGGINIRIVSGIFFILALATNIAWAAIGFSVSSYIIISGIFILLFLLIARMIFAAKL